MDSWLEHEQVADSTSIIVPAYFSTKPSDETVRKLLWMTLGDCHHYVPLNQVWVVVDGDERTAALAREVQGKLGEAQGETMHVLPLPENRGKLWAIRAGMKACLETLPDIEYLVVRDGDGDHIASAVPQLVRAAAFLRQVYGHLRLIVIGSRPTRYHPMGWVRGELEALLDQITLDALAYALARQGRAPNLAHCARRGVPDLSSGFKVFGREIAVTLFQTSEPHFGTLEPSDYWHYGPETVTIIEAMLRDVVIAEALRPTWDGQPTTSFGEFRNVSLYGELLAWVYTRLQIPLDAAAQMYDNRAMALDLRTTAQGREALEALRAHALAKVLGESPDAGPVPPPRPLLPFL